MNSVSIFADVGISSNIAVMSNFNENNVKVGGHKYNINLEAGLDNNTSYFLLGYEKHNINFSSPNFLYNINLEDSYNLIVVGLKVFLGDKSPAFILPKLGKVLSSNNDDKFGSLSFGFQVSGNDEKLKLNIMAGIFTYDFESKMYDLSLGLKYTF